MPDPTPTPVQPSPLLIDTLTAAITSSVQANQAALVAKAGSVIGDIDLTIAWPFIEAIIPDIAKLVYLVILYEVGAMGPASLAGRLDGDYATVTANPGTYELGTLKDPTP